jgi:hypothetical protein
LRQPRVDQRQRKPADGIFWCIATHD